MAISEETVKRGFKLFLGRVPESGDAVKAHMNLPDELTLAKVLVDSKEFALSNSIEIFNGIKNITEEWRSSSKMRILVVGNCQVTGIASLMQAMSEDVITLNYVLTEKFIIDLKDGTLDIKPFVHCDLILAHPRNDWIDILELSIPRVRDKIKYIPTISFSAFHPDCVYVETKNKHLSSPIGAYNSSLAFYAWKTGLSHEKTIRLFSADVYEELGFFKYWNSSVEFLTKSWDFSGLSLGNNISRWSKYGSWMHSINHPKLFVLADVASACLEREGISKIPYVENYLKDDLSTHPCWPVYPEIGQALELIDLPPPFFKKGINLCPPDRQVVMLGLDEFVRQSFGIYDKYGKGDLHCDRTNNDLYQKLDKFIKKKSSKNKEDKDISPSTNLATTNKIKSSPYKNLPDYQFWRRAIERLPMKNVDPIINPRFTICKTDKVATAGSCFAQHISRTLQQQGFNYYVSEKGNTGFVSEEAQRKNYGVFSARFGNLYTARQLIQLFDRAYGTYVPVDNYWIRGDGKFVDPFRPQVEPDGFTSIDDLENDRVKHFSAVRGMFESLDVLVFTLGLTETWRNRIDGAVFPLAPGVVAGEMDPNLYEFVNFGVSDVINDMQSFIERLLIVNPNSKMLLTVSPVPLIATYEDRHVLVSTTYSKSVLRAAAEEVCKNSMICEYFPSYEIITGNYTKGQYFESDLRSIKPEGVNHVMQLFLQHYSSEKVTNIIESDTDVLDLDLMRENARMNKIICDEEALDDAGLCS